MKLRSILAAGAASLAVAASVGPVTNSAYAQETTASVRGQVTSDAGSPVAGATITVTDERTGQTRRATADADGRFRVVNLPAGGPYTITAEGAGLAGERIEDVTLTVGDASVLRFALASGATDEIVVVGTRQVLANVAPGPSVTFTAEDLAELPTTNRDIKDIVKLDPRVYVDETFGDGIYCVGSSNRSNSLTLDGYNLNDGFGLNANGYPTQRLPFPYDVAEQVSVEIAPFDVEYGGFTGCNINVVTRTGTDDFSGRIAFDFQNLDSMRGNSIEGEEFSNPDIDEYTIAGYLSGPIIQDRVYFTAGYEKFNGGDTSATSFAGSGFPNEVAGVTADDVARIQEIARRVYGFEAGDIPNGLDVEDERFFGKLDIYLTDQHRAELSGQYTLGNSISIQNTSAFNEEIGLSSNWYDRSEELTVFSGRVFSDWTENFSTEVRLSYQDRTTGQESLGGTDFAQIEVETAGGGSVFFGPDVFRHANRLEQEAFNAKVKGDYTVGNHLITAGYEYDTIDVFNLFVAFAEGEAVFSSIDDLENQTPDNIFYVNAGTNNEEDGAASFSTAKHTFYLQDIWSVTPDVEVTTGLRIDSYDVDDKPVYNPAFQARYGIRNDDNLNAKSLVQPRIAVDWAATDRLSVTGGIGLFSGGEPGVWVSNNYSNNGVTLGSAFSNDPAEINGFDGFNLPQALLDQNAEAAANADGFVNALDPNYEIPSVLRVSLGAQYDLDLTRFNLGDGWQVGGDLLYGRTYNPNQWVSLNSQVVATAPDGRPIYAGVDLSDADCAGLTYTPGQAFDYGDCDARAGRSGDGDFLLTNADDEPEQFVLSAYARQEWEVGDTDLSAFLGYAYTQAEDVNPGTSSRAISNFENYSVADINNPSVATSNYEIPHRFTGRFDVAHEWAEGWRSRASFRGQFQQGRPYSLTFDAGRARDGFPNGLNLFGDTDASADRLLAYVPTGIDDPNLDVANSDAGALADYVAFFADSDYDDFRGGIIDRNTENSDWWGKIDLRLSQEVPLPKTLGDDRLRFVLDIDNLTNLINDEWGLYREVGFPYRSQVVEAQLTEDGYAVTDFNGAPRQFVRTGVSVWDIQIGVRYEF